MLQKCFLTLTLIFTTSSCYGDVILYDESVSGDLAPQSAVNHDLDEPLSLFTLTPGVNHVLGTMSYRNGAGIVWDIDAFAITILAGYELTSLGFDAHRTLGKATSFTMAVSPGVVFNNSNIDDPPRPAILGVVTTQIPSTGASVSFPDFFPIAAGDYAISFDQGTLLDGEFQSNPFAWNARLTLTAVPEPSMTALICIAFLPPFLRRKRCYTVNSRKD